MSADSRKGQRPGGATLSAYKHLTYAPVTEYFANCARLYCTQAGPAAMSSRRSDLHRTSHTPYSAATKGSATTLRARRTVLVTREQASLRRQTSCRCCSGGFIRPAGAKASAGNVEFREAGRAVVAHPAPLTRLYSPSSSPVRLTSLLKRSRLPSSPLMSR